MNLCKFSENRRYRYELVHRCDDLLTTGELRFLVWVGLNPSTADEQALDPTLKRIRAFTQREGYHGFVMLNLFAWRDTDPDQMMREMDPVGRENDDTLRKWSKPGQKIVCAWGNHGGHLSRWRKVAEMMKAAGAELVCLSTNADGSPKHPLYVKSDTPLQPWSIPREIIEEPWQRRKRKKAARRLAERAYYGAGNW